MKLTVSKSKNATNFYVQKTIRREDGKTTTMTVEKLGNLDAVRTRANGGDPYRWAQAYVDELNRKQYEEQSAIIVSYSPKKLIKPSEQHAFNCGYLFLQRLYYQLGLDKICLKIAGRHDFSFNLNDILSKLVYSRLLYPASKRATTELAERFLERPSFALHDVYRALSVLAQESDFIQAALYHNSRALFERRTQVLYYDCTNYYFESEADDFRQYGHSKQHQPLPLVGMGLFVDGDGIPLAFSLFPGNQNEQPSLKPLEQRIIRDFGCENIIVCTDAGLSSEANRRFNDLSIGGSQVRCFITTQPIKKLPKDMQAFALDPNGWHLANDDRLYSLSDLVPERDYNKVFYKETYMVSEVSKAQAANHEQPLSQRLIVSFSLKYQLYQANIRADQIERAQKIIDQGGKKRKAKTENDPMRFVGAAHSTKDGEVCSEETLFLDTEAIAKEAMYDGFYAVCTNLRDKTEDIIAVNKRRWKIEESFRVMKTEFKARPVYLQREDRIHAHFLTCFLTLTIYRYLEKQLGEKYTCDNILQTLRNMQMTRPGKKQGYMPSYTRTELTDKLHETSGFRTDYEITTDTNMKKIISQSKGKKAKSRYV